MFFFIDSLTQTNAWMSVKISTSHFQWFYMIVWHFSSAWIWIDLTYTDTQ